MMNAFYFQEKGRKSVKKSFVKSILKSQFDEKKNHNWFYGFSVKLILQSTSMYII